MQQPIRPRRLRNNEALRSLVRETQVHISDLIAPLFVAESESMAGAINSMPGVRRHSTKELLEEVSRLRQLGIKSVVLFPALENKNKDAKALAALDPDCFYYKIIDQIKQRFDDVVIMSDVALDPYCDHGHDGLVDEKSGEIKNDETIEVLVQMSLLQAKAGVDIIGPSDMMDGRVGAIRAALEQENYKNVSIMSYTAKYASAFYGPFREALASAPKKGDKKSYQMDPANRLEAQKEAMLDMQEGADILMVKPALAYLDIVRELKDKTSYPIAGYNVSGEYAMVKNQALSGLCDEKAMVKEVLTCFKRAGCDMILTYHAADYASWVNQ